MKTKKLFASVLLAIGMMAMLFTSCESEDVKNEKKFDGEWLLESYQETEYKNGETYEGGIDTTFTGLNAIARFPYSRIIFYKDKKEAYILYDGRAISFTYQVMGQKLFLKMEDENMSMILDIISLSDTEIVISMPSYEYYSYNDELTEDPENPVYDLYTYKTTLTYTKQ
ncbi:MAG: hypothetical protein J5808_07450 [Paludibacteraceae bacterium]|nr:hypothetical protein [Paludibacteraceae bacterium]